MPTAPYIPAQNNAFLGWIDNFASLITADPARYGLDAVAAAAIQTAADNFDAAFALAGTTAPPHPVPVNPAARTPVTVAAMAATKGASTATVRPYAQQIRINPGVTNDDKVALGLNLQNTSPSPVPAPVSYPLLSLLSGGPLTHTFSYKDSMTAVGKRKPDGVVQMQLVGAAAVAAATDPDTLPPLPAQTKSPFMIVWSSGDGSKIASYAARWVTRKGLVGPWSPILTAVVMPV